MKVVGFAGYSGSGKTTLIEQLITDFKSRGLRVSVVKHAHHRFDIDQPGKDSYRHRSAGAFEVLVASNRRSALIREYERESDPTVHQLLAQLYEGVDWVFVEGFKYSDLLKLEVWRQSAGHPARYMDDDFVVAIATDDASKLPEATQRPVLDINQPKAVADWMIEQGHRFEYEFR
jgi:molybdopterin-guanine dinucleotide biosynthesis adapter protein